MAWRVSPSGHSAGLSPGQFHDQRRPADSPHATAHATTHANRQCAPALHRLETLVLRAAAGRRGRETKGAGAVVEQPEPEFAELLRQLRAEARLTQEELAEAASLSPRSVSDLERGVHRTARKDTAVLLSGALGLAEPAR